MKKTVVMGATPNPGRYAYLATQRLAKYGHEVVPVGMRKGAIGNLAIQQGQPEVEDVDTVTLYMNEDCQKPVEDYILSLHPKRIIFNPGAENPALEKKAAEQGIETVAGCTLVMLSIGVY